MRSFSLSLSVSQVLTVVSVLASLAPSRAEAACPGGFNGNACNNVCVYSGAADRWTCTVSGGVSSVTVVQDFSTDFDFEAWGSNNGALFCCQIDHSANEPITSIHIEGSDYADTLSFSHANITYNLRTHTGGTLLTGSIDGNNGNDIINGSNQVGDYTETLNGGNDLDTIKGMGGADLLNGDNGEDTILGGDGSDTIDGGDGDDTLNGGAGDDTIYGGSGEDTIDGAGGNDLVDGEDDKDVIEGSGGDDDLNGGDGGDILRGGDGNDIISGDGGEDVLCGNGEAGGGDFLYDGGFGPDKLWGASINDTNTCTPGAGSLSDLFSAVLGGCGVLASIPPECQ